MWRGFFTESREFCGYGAKSPWDKVRWWLAYPKAWVVFHLLGLKFRFYRSSLFQHLLTFPSFRHMVERIAERR